jgi:hypothetical protein
MRREQTMLFLAKAVVAVVLLFAWSLGGAAPPSPKTCRSSLPDGLVSTLEGKGRTWRLVEVRDLSEDDRRIWSELNHGPCPGVATANFDQSGKPQFAVLLRSPSKRIRLVYASFRPAEKYSTRVLYEGTSEPTPVVFAGTPGKYRSSADPDRVVTLKTPPIVLAVLEAGATAYYFEHGRLKELVISE